MVAPYEIKAVTTIAADRRSERGDDDDDDASTAAKDGRPATLVPRVLLAQHHGCVLRAALGAHPTHGELQAWLRVLRQHAGRHFFAAAQALQGTHADPTAADHPAAHQHHHGPPARVPRLLHSVVLKFHLLP